MEGPCVLYFLTCAEWCTKETLSSSGGRAEGVKDRIWGVKNTGLNHLGIRVFILAVGLTLPQTWEVMLTSVVLRK